MSYAVGVNMADDFTTIKGIGPARAEALVDDFGIETYADLASLDIDDLVSALRARGQVVKRASAALWIAEAESRSAVRSDGWEITALIVVYFEERSGELRTIARRVDTDTDAQWPGHPTSEVGAWMAERLGGASSGPADRGPAVQPDDAGARSGEPEDLVTGVRLYQPPDADRAHAIAHDGNIHQLVVAHVPFMVELDPEPGVVPSGLCVQSKLIGTSQPAVTRWSPSNQTPDATFTAIVVDGLARGLYRLVVVAEDTHVEQDGPLLLVD